jgi:hypothetical protein
MIYNWWSKHDNYAISIYTTQTSHLRCVWYHSMQILEIIIYKLCIIVALPEKVK